VHVDRVLHDGDTVSLGGTTLTAVWAPGHTPGCTVWTTTVADHARRYAVAFYACPGPNGETPLFGNARFPDIVEQSLASFRKLLRLRPDIYLMMHPWDQFLADKVDRLKAGEMPHPLDDPRAWIQALEDDRADLEQRIAAERVSPSR